MEIKLETSTILVWCSPVGANYILTSNCQVTSDTGNNIFAEFFLAIPSVSLLYQHYQLYTFRKSLICQLALTSVTTEIKIWKKCQIRILNYYQSRCKNLHWTTCIYSHIPTHQIVNNIYLLPHIYTSNCGQHISTPTYLHIQL